MIRTASTRAAPLLSPFYLFTKIPHTSYIRLTGTDWARSILQRGYLTLTPPNNHTDLLQLYTPPLLSDRAGGWESRSIVVGTLSAAVLLYHAGAITTVDDQGSGLVAQRSDHGLSSRLSNIPIFSEFQNPSTKPHIPDGRLQSVMAQEFWIIFSRVDSWMDYHHIV